MSYTALLLSLFVVDILAAISPGPNFVLVTQTAIHRSTRDALAVVAGFVTTNFIWCLAVVLGLTVLFDVAPWLYVAVKVFGGAYLVYLGISMWRSRLASTARPSRRSPYLIGVLTNLTNPKSVVYFGSIFALFMKPGTPRWVEAAAIIIVLANTILWYGTVAMLFSRSVVQRGYARARRAIDALAGAVMIAFGARLIATVRQP
jgi:threonine efflux protein